MCYGVLFGAKVVEAAPPLLSLNLITGKKTEQTSRSHVRDQVTLLQVPLEVHEEVQSCLLRQT